MTADTRNNFTAAAEPGRVRRALLSMRRNQLAGLVSVVTGLLLWEALSRVLVANSLFLAAPSQIVGAIIQLARTGELWRHVGVSAWEFAIGYVIASFIGIGLGLAMASSVTTKQVLQPWISGLYATPTIALARCERDDTLPGWVGDERSVATIARTTDSGCRALSGPSR